MEHKIFEMPFANIYPHYLNKVTKKDRNEKELLEVIMWLTGYNTQEIESIIEENITLKNFFANAPKLNDNIGLITGTICGYKVEEIEDPLMQKIRYMDKLVDELAKGKSMDKILRK